MKLIKFDLPIDGVKVKTIEELREHFTIEILDHYRSGLLGKWLRCRGMDEDVAALVALDGLDEHALLKGVSEIFRVEVDDLIIFAMLEEPPQNIGQNVTEITQVYDDLAETIDYSIYRAIRMNCITSSSNGKMRWDNVAHSKEDKRDKRNPFLKGDLLLNDLVENKYTAPGVCELISPLPEDQLAKKGDIVGWILMSEHAEDYFSNWNTFSAFLIQRKDMLFSTAQKVCIPLLKSALDRRTDQLKAIIETLTEASKDSSEFKSLLALSPDQRRMIFFDRSEKLTEVKNYEEDSFNQLIKLLVKPGDRVFTNDPIAELKGLYYPIEIRSTSTGIVREVLPRIGDKVPFGGVLIKVEQLDY